MNARDRRQGRPWLRRGITPILFVACAQTASSVSVDASSPSDAPRPSDLTAPSDTVAPSDVTDPVDAAAPVDVAAPIDGPPVGRECLRASDCTAAPLFGQTFGQGWSCIQGRCTWEQSAGRSCTRADDGCFTCDDGARTCAGTPCITSLRRQDIELERAWCARDFLAGLRSCAGGFVSLDDMVCTLSDAPTGAIRWVLACGPCELVLTPAPRG